VYRYNFVKILNTEFNVVSKVQWRLQTLCRHVYAMDQHTPKVIMCVEVSTITFFNSAFLNGNFHRVIIIYPCVKSVIYETNSRIPTINLLLSDQQSVSAWPIVLYYLWLKENVNLCDSHNYNTVWFWLAQHNLGSLLYFAINFMCSQVWGSQLYRGICDLLITP